MERKFLEDMKLEKEVIDKIMAENGKDIESQKKKTESAEKERDDAKKTLQETQETLKGFEGVDVKELNDKINELSGKITADGENHAKEMTALKTKHAAEKYLGTHKFSSELAKKAALAEFMEAGLTYDEKSDSFMGADDFMKKMKETSPTAFIVEDGEGGQDVKPPAKWGAQPGEQGKPPKAPETLIGALHEKYDKK